jgi:purine nucleosidase
MTDSEAAAASPGHPPSIGRIPVVIDVDTGIDDSLALLYACASPEIEVLAVTCVGGNVDARQVAMNTRAVLELAGRTDIPVALGREQLLRKAMETAADTHGPQGIGHAVLPPPSRALEPDDAADRLISLARAKPGKVLLVTLGPLTNLAVALEREPRLPRLLRSYTLMGGASGVPGNTSPTTVWKVHDDPDAAQAVRAAGGAAIRADPAVPLPLAMGLDVTEQARFLPQHNATRARRAGATEADAAATGANPLVARGTAAADPIVSFIVDALRFYFEFHARYDAFYGAFIHDPFAVAAAIDRSLVSTRALPVDVETGPGLAHGMTVADWRGLTGHAPNLDVAVEADAETFFGRFIDRVGRLAAERSRVAR